MKSKSETFEAQKTSLEKNPFGIVIFKKDGNLNAFAAEEIRKAAHPGKYHFFQWGRNGQSAKDLSHYVRRAMYLGGYEIQEGNDAPRGGKEGNYIYIPEEAAEFLRGLLS